MKENGLESKVRANAAIGKLNLKQYANKPEGIHHRICKELVELSDENKDEKGKPFPICYIVYFAVGKNAHRTEVFDEGYKTIDMEKARSIIYWARLAAAHHGNPKMARNPELLHALTRYYERVDKKTTKFSRTLNKSKAEPKLAKFKDFIESLGI